MQVVSYVYNNVGDLHVASAVCNLVLKFSHLGIDPPSMVLFNISDGCAQNFQSGATA